MVQWFNSMVVNGSTQNLTWYGVCISCYSCIDLFFFLLPAVSDNARCQFLYFLTRIGSIKYLVWDFSKCNGHFGNAYKMCRSLANFLSCIPFYAENYLYCFCL